jgi:hypothetical protein
VQACVRKRRSRTDTSPAPTAQQQQYWIRRGRELARVRETEAVRCRRYKYAHTHTCTAKHANREPIAPASQWPEVKHLVLLYTFHAALACSPSNPRRGTYNDRRAAKLWPPDQASAAACSSPCCCRVPRWADSLSWRCVHNGPKDTWTAAGRQKRRLPIDCDCTGRAQCRLQPRSERRILQGAVADTHARVRSHGSDGSRLDVDKLYCLRGRQQLSIIEYKLLFL